MKKICLISDHHLCINPRLWKEAFLYEKLGFDVTILTKWQSDELLQRDIQLLGGHSICYRSYLNIIRGEIPEWRRFYIRLRRRIASELQKYFNLGCSWAINHSPNLLYHKALEIKADFYSAHLESGFYAGRKLILAGMKVSFDFEDWYSNDYLTPDRAIGLLKKLELFALRNGTFCMAASESMGIALQKQYGCASIPLTIYNSFPDNQVWNFPDESKNIGDRFKFVWTSRTIGPKRGLENFLKAAARVHYQFELHLIGDCSEDYRSFLEEEFPYSVGHNLVFHKFMSHEELQQFLPKFDAGLAIELSQPESRNVTITNKILQYIQSGLQVLATDTIGQIELSNQFTSVVLISNSDVGSWSKGIEQIINNKREFNNGLQKCTYDEYFSWSKQEEKLENLINKNL